MTRVLSSLWVVVLGLGAAPAWAVSLVQVEFSGNLHTVTYYNEEPEYPHVEEGSFPINYDFSAGFIFDMEVLSHVPDTSGVTPAGSGFFGGGAAYDEGDGVSGYELGYSGFFFDITLISNPAADGFGSPDGIPCTVECTLVAPPDGNGTALDVYGDDDGPGLSFELYGGAPFQFINGAFQLFPTVGTDGRVGFFDVYEGWGVRGDITEWSVSGVGPQPQAVPEPGTFLLLVPALGALAIARRRRA